MKTKRQYASSLPAKRTVVNARTIERSFDPARKLSTAAKKRLAELARVPKAKIDYSEIPPITDAAFRSAMRNPYFRPLKQQITLRLDADVIAWLRRGGKGYQTRLNEILRREMRRELLDLIDDADAAPNAPPSIASARRISSANLASAHPIASARRKAS